VGSDVQSVVRAARIAAQKEAVVRLKQERRRLLGMITTVNLSAESKANLDNLLRALQGKLDREINVLAELEDGLG
jgi:hypothetical protein